MRTRRLISLTFSLLWIASLACGLGGAGGTPASPPAPPPAPLSASPATALPSPTPTPEPPPVDLYDAMQSKVRSGEWTQGQAIVETLKVFTGANDASALFGPGQKVEIHSAWGISMTALDYLQNGDDEAAKVEIERLLGVIAPGADHLDAYAEPAPTGGRRAPGLAAPLPLQTETDCRALWDIGFPTDTTPRPVCLRYETAVSFAGEEIRVYYPREWADRADVRRRIEAALDATIKAYTTYNMLGLDLRSANIIFTPLQPTSYADALAMVPGRSLTIIEAEPCPVVVFPLSGTLSADEFKQTIAHEFFHCAQYWRYGFPGVYDSTRWWIEGSAEYFSNVVYSRFDYEHVWNDDFQAISGPSPTPLVRLSYPAWVFFQYYANRFDDSGVIALLDSLPTEGGLDGQIAALYRRAGFGDFFHDFGKAYVDGRIEDAGGGVLTFAPQFTDTFEFPSDTPAILAAATLTIPYYKLIFHPGHSFLVSQEWVGEGRNSARPSDDGDEWGWGSLPEGEIRTGCADKNYRDIITNSEPGGLYNSISLELDVETLEVSSLTTDPCLIGQWQLNFFSLRPYFEEMLGDMLDSAEGSGSLNFWDDCTLSGNMESAVQYHLVDVQSRRTIFNVQTSSVSIASWGATEVEGRLAGGLVIFDTEGTINSYSTITVDGKTVGADTTPPDGGAGGGFPSDNEFPYVCTATTLTVYPPPGLEGAPDGWFYMRVSP